MQKSRFKAGFGSYFAIYILALFLGTASATILKLYSTDPVSGFVNTGSFPYDHILVYVFRLSLLLSIVLWFVVTIRRRANHDFPISYRHWPSSILSILTGLSMIAYTLTSLPTQVLRPYSGELNNKLMLIFSIVFGLMGGISMIVGGARSRYGVSGKPGAMLGFFPALWQLVILLTRYNDFTAVTTNIDVLLLILFMCFAAMFLIGQSRIIFGLGIRDGKTYAIPAGLSTSLVGLIFILSNLIYAFTYKHLLIFVSINWAELLYIAFLSLYSVTFLAGYSRSIRVV